MATVVGLTAERMLEIEGSSVVDGEVNEDGDLSLITKDGSEIPLGNVRGEQGPTGPAGTIGDVWPVGSIYISVDSVNPSTLFGGVWSQTAKGRVLVGVDPVQTEFDEAGKVGGEKTHVLTEAEMPAHSHTNNHDHPPFDTASAGAHLHAGVQFTSNDDGLNNQVKRDGAGSGSAGFAAYDPDGEHIHEIDVPEYIGDSGSAGAGQAHNNLQPYIAVYIWERTA